MATENAERRRAELTDIVYRIVAERGLDAVSVRTIASEASTSIGTVQHYFATKEAMLEHALARVVAQVGERVQRDWTPPIGPCVRELLLQALPLDDVRRDELRVWLAFFGYETFVKSAGATVGASAKLEQSLIQALGACQRLGEMDESLDIEQEASMLNALSEGLAYRCLADQDGYGPERTVAVLDAHLVRILPTCKETPA